MSKLQVPTEKEAMFFNIVYMGGYLGNQGFIGGNRADIFFTPNTSSLSIDAKSGNDRIYGSTQTDILNGGEGNDTLIDESGDDKYEFVGEYGHDTIYDNDGKGEISIDYIPLSAEEQITDSSWSTSNENYMINIAKTEYNVIGYYTLIIKHKYDSNKSITIQNWKQGDFGLNLIHLGEEHKTQENTGFVFGNDLHNIIYDQQYVAAFAGDDLIQTTQYDDIVIDDDVIMLVADKGAKYVVYSLY